MSKRVSRYHGLLIVDKPGLAQSHIASDTVRDSITGSQTTGDAFVVDGPNTLTQTGQFSSVSQSSVSQPSAVEPDGSSLPTSHDIVQMARRWSGQRRVGHTGTLDPLASGVLVLCLGYATRLVEYYQGHDKEYEAEVTLGRATDTYDGLGQTTAEAHVPPLTAGEIDAVLDRFRGDVMQVPPIYSALKRGGESLHRKARRGEAVKLDPRPVSFHQLDLLRYNPPNKLHLRVVCSAGGYIRSLAHDVGQALNTVGHLSQLRRAAAGAFTLADAYSVGQIEAAAQDKCLGNLLLPPGSGLTMPHLALDDEAIQRFGFGQKVVLADADHLAALDMNTPLAQGIDQNGRFLGIVRCLGPATTDVGVDSPSGGHIWKAEKWFAQDIDRT